MTLPSCCNWGCWARARWLGGPLPSSTHCLRIPRFYPGWLSPNQTRYNVFFLFCGLLLFRNQGIQSHWGQRYAFFFESHNYRFLSSLRARIRSRFLFKT